MKWATLNLKKIHLDYVQTQWWLFCNKVETVLFITVTPAGEEVTKKYTHGRERKISGEMKRKKRKMEVMVHFKREPLIILHGPSLRMLTFFLCDGHTKIGLSMVPKL